jgi:integrase
MALEMRKESKWWYGRVTLDGRDVCKNLGVEIAGQIPLSLKQSGDASFERSRGKAQAALEKLQADFKRRSTSAELVQTIHEIRMGDRVHSVLLSEMAARWVALPRRRPPSERYIAQVESWVKRFVSFLGDRFPMAKEMADVQPAMSREFLAGEEKRGVAPKTYNNTLILLRSSFQALRQEAGLAHNPFDGFPTREEDTVFRKPFDADELPHIIEAAKSDPFIYPILVTAMCTAMRRGDCCLLLKSAVDLPNRFIKVKTSKTGELVQIPIFPLLYEVLAVAKPSDGLYVFPEQATMYQCNPDGITYRVRLVLRKAGFFDPEDERKGEKKGRGEIHQKRPNGLRQGSVRDFHSFRVTWVTLALTAGVPLEIVQKITGHRTAGIVMKHYFQPGREEFRRTLAGRLPVLLGGGSGPKPIGPGELLTELQAMKPRTWRKIRDCLVARIPQPKEISVATTPVPTSA